MTNHVYLVSYKGGMFGEFLTSLVGLDPSYYGNESNMIQKGNNRWTQISYLREKFGFDLHTLFYKSKPLVVNNKVREQIIKDLKLYNIIVRNHFFDENITYNLPYLRKIVFDGETEKDFLYSFMMHVLKILCISHTLTATDLRDLEVRVNQPFSIARHKKLKEGDSVSWLYIYSMSYNTQSVRGILNDVWKWHSTPHVLKPQSTWTRLCPHKLLRNPEEEMPLWKKTFSLTQDLDIEKIKKYHADNLSLIENFLEEPFESLTVSNAIQKSMIKLLPYYTVNHA